MTDRPASFVVVACDHGTLIVNRNDYRMHNEKDGYGVGFQLFTRSHFDPSEIELAVTMIKMRRAAFGEGVVALDCGANIGVHTIEWAKAMHGWGEVTAIEAQERIYYALCGNIAINNCFNARAINAAVGAAPGSMLMPQPDYHTPSSFGSLELRRRENTEFIGQDIDYEEQSRPIGVVSIDAFEFERLDFVKIDVEGMELDVLEGGKQTIERHRPQMLIETIKTDRDALLERLRRWGYEVHQVDINVLAVHRSDPCLRKLAVT